ncbi:hypothetical protein MASSI9I_90704 [Massilia sp. 9I]|nr:hypothetical protein MASSI9I_90704 [Massilia sp. 9I]
MHYGYDTLVPCAMGFRGGVFSPEE